jgi:hypothetical protein
MPISEPEWASIRNMVETVVGDMAGNRASHFTTGKVIKRDETKKLVWLEEFGDQPIPIIGFDYEVKYYYASSAGLSTPATGGGLPSKTITKTVKVKVKVPKVGDTVVVAREFGSRRIPRCLGVIQGKGWIVAESE